MTAINAPYSKRQLDGRSLFFFGAFVLPALKLLDAPALLARYAAGDLLFPAFLHYLLQGGVIFLILLFAKKTGKGIFTLAKETFGKWSYYLLLCLYALFFLLYSLKHLLDVEKFTYVLFYDTAPSVFTFAPFFLLSGYISAKSLKSLGRFSALCFPIFLISLTFLLAASVKQADFSALLPLFEQPFSKIRLSFEKTVPHFFDAALFLPLTEKYRYQKGDVKKAVGGYLLGGLFTLLYLAVYFGVYQSIAYREHFAIAKIAQYFPAFSIVGRLDLIFVYLYTAVLFFAISIPVLLSVDCIFTAFPLKSRVPYAFVLNTLLFLFVLFFNKRYNFISSLILNLSPVFWVFSVGLPVLLSVIFLILDKIKGAGKRFKGERV